MWLTGAQQVTQLASIIAVISDMPFLDICVDRLRAEVEDDAGTGLSAEVGNEAGIVDCFWGVFYKPTTNNRKVLEQSPLETIPPVQK